MLGEKKKKKAKLSRVCLHLPPEALPPIFTNGEHRLKCIFTSDVGHSPLTVHCISFSCPKERSTNKIRAHNEIQQRKVAEMEATFARIRQATGVNTLEEVVLKLANQSTNHTTLEEEKREAESKLARAKAARQSEDARFSCMKASGVGNTELNREISDKLNNEIQEYRVEVRSVSIRTT